MLKLIRNPFAVIIALLGFVVPIVWDLYKTTTSIEVQVLESIKLIEPSERIEKIEIRYDGKLIPRASRLTIGVLNSGRTPLKTADFIAPLSIKLGPQSNILDFRIEKKSPSDLEVDFKKNDDKGEVEMMFPLMNPNDYVKLSLLVGGDVSGLSVGGRVVGVEKILLIDRTKELERRNSRAYSVLVPQLILGILFLIIGIVFIFMVPGEWRLKEGVRSGAIKLPAFADADGYEGYLYKKLRFSSNEDIHRLDELMDLIKGKKTSIKFLFMRWSGYLNEGRGILGVYCL